MHAKMYALGSKYGIDSLKATALGRYSEAANYAFNSASFIEAIRIVYTTTPEDDKGPREITPQTIHANSAELADKPEMQRIVRSIDGLAYELWRKSCGFGSEGSASSSAFEMQCPYCSRIQGVSHGKYDHSCGYCIQKVPQPYFYRRSC